MKLKELISILEEWAPKTYAEDFDNVGLLVGNINTEITAALVTLDTNTRVVEEAIAANCNCIITFHPIIFKGLKSITGKNHVEKTLIKAIKNNIAIYAIHTNLDAIQTGVNAKICQTIGIQNPQILIPKNNTLYKLNTYVPKGEEEELLSHLHQAGAGNIGEYSNCSFLLEGTGRFTPSNHSNPTIGTPLKAEKVEEVNLQLIVEKHALNAVIRSLQKNHSYEEVAYEIFEIQNQNQTKGMGMIGELENEVSEKEFLLHLKDKFNLKNIRHTAFLNKKVKKVAVLGGSGSFALSQAKNQNADVFISADFKYHDFFNAENQILIADIGHYESEQYTKNLIIDYITKKIPNFAIQISNINTNPIYYF